MIDARILRPDGSAAVIDAELIDVHRVNGDGLIWVDVADPSSEQLQMLANEFDLHPLALEGALQHNERSKVERFPSHAFVVLYDAEGSRLTLFVGPTWVVMARAAAPDGQIWTPEVVRDRIARSGRPPSPGDLIHLVVDAVTDDYEDRIDAIADEVETLEEVILDPTTPTSDATQRNMLTLRRELLELRRRVVPARDIVQELRRGRGDGFDDDEVDIGLADVHDHLLRIVDQIDAERELLGNAFDAHLAMMSNQMNLVMKKLTAWGSIVFGATLIAGIYGMNFQHMPELGWQLGYPMALGMMALLSYVLYRLFRRRDWL